MLCISLPYSARFESTIRAQFFGHTHYDSFSVFYEQADPTGRATNVMYVGSLLWPFRATNTIPSDYNAGFVLTVLKLKALLHTLGLF